MTLELASMAMGAATTASGEASPTEMPGYAMYGKKGGDGANGHSPDHRSPKEQPMTVIEDDDSPGDVNRPPALLVADVDHDASPLRGLYKLRKNRSFCDVILQVEHRLRDKRPLLRGIGALFTPDKWFDALSLVNSGVYSAGTRVILF